MEQDDPQTTPQDELDRLRDELVGAVLARIDRAGSGEAGLRRLRRHALEVAALAEELAELALLVSRLNRDEQQGA